LDRGLVEKATIRRLGRGRSIAILGLTSAGRDVLRAFDVPLPPGRGGTIHTYYCHLIAEYLTKRGIDCEIETERLKGARVDVCAMPGDHQWTAIEVECSGGNEVRNIASDLDAGYHAVVSLFKDGTRIGRIRESLGVEIAPERLAQVTLGDLTNFETVLDQALNPGGTTVTADP